MGKQTGFMDFPRINPPKRPIDERVRDFLEIEGQLETADLQQQGGRCMDCGAPSCHAFGCPVHNRIPDWNDMIYLGQWKRALDLLQETNPFPEITGRICPAPCETACTLAINQEPVTIRQIELAIVERGWREGWIQPVPSEIKSGKRVAVIGSGPAGLAAAQRIARKGHGAVVFEKSDRIGGLLRYGIPDFKLEKSTIDRRLEQMKAEGVKFETEVAAGIDMSAGYLKRSFDAVLITAGAGMPRDLDVPGRKLKGIHFALDFLTQQNRLNSGESIPKPKAISAKGLKVVVIGGGDTGSDCVGTSIRQGAKSVTQIELLPKPPESRPEDNPWPNWPNVMRTSTSQDEGCERDWGVLTKAFIGQGKVKKLSCVRIEWFRDATGFKFKEIPGSAFELEADLVLLATGFVHVEHGPLIKDFGIELTPAGHIAVDGSFMTSAAGVFAAGDSVLGASLVVKAIYQGLAAADGVDAYLRRNGRVVKTG